MAVALNQFLNEISNNAIRTTNSFEMYVSTGYADIDDALKNITMFGQGFEIPSRTVNYAAVSFKGYSVTNAVPTNMEMTNTHSITINADVNGELRRAFLAWQAKTMDPAISDGSVFNGDRRVNSNSVVRIHLLDYDMKGVAEIYKLINVKVAEVGPMTVSNNDSGVATFNVTLNSTYWEIEKAENGKFKDQK